VTFILVALSQYSQPPEELLTTHLRVEDLGGRLIIPGLIDSHIHVGMTGECEEYVSLAGWVGSSI